MEINFANNKCARNVEKDYKNIRHAFAITILDMLIDCEFPRLTALYNKLHFL